MKPVQAFNVYALVRKQKPGVLVETGVCNGFSTAVILAALERNGSGHLYSVDYPEFTGPSGNGVEFWEGKGGAVVPAGRSSGWLVPQGLRGHWSLELGKSQDVLPALLSRVSPIDFFLHDSEHSLENQLFEFRAAFEALSPGGLLLASDITWSEAFEVFCREQRAATRPCFVDHNLAIIGKRPVTRPGRDH